tara:strand:- start:924 stop:2309 length:1386 start_codon:yes stop_codon:yes gene_type:complete
MTKYVIFGRLGPADAFRPPRAVDTVATTLDLLDAAGSLRFGVDRALKHLAGWHLTPTAVGIDLITLAAHVHAADTRLNRVQASQDGWMREISIVVPVSDVAVWDRATAVLERMLRFLTGDLWAVRFRPLPRSGRPPLSRQPRSRTRHPFTGVSLFSGGLDSLIGAVDELHEGGFPLFVSHGGEGGVSAPQGRLFRELAARQADHARPVRLRLAMTIPSNLVAGIGGENSTRGRSFLFFAAAAFAGSAFARPFDLRVPENGLIFLNVPLDVTRVGSNSTRTTHPFYIHRWNELLATVGIRGRVVNPYWDRTKGEMVDGCANPAALEALAPLSLSCAHPSTRRWYAGDHAHCGYCLPCIIRRASLLRTPWDGRDETGYALDDLTSEVLDTTKAKGRQVRGFQYAIARLRERPELAETWVYKPGPLLEDAAIVPDLVGVYRRGMAEVAEVLGDVEARPLDGRDG